MALDPLKFQVAIQDEATGQLNKIEQEFNKLKDKTISVKVEGLQDLQNLLSALQHKQVETLGKDVAAGIHDAAKGLQEEAQKAVRASLGKLAEDLVAVKTAIQHDNFTAFSTRIEKCAQAVNTLDAAFKQFQVTIGADAGMKNFMTGLGEVIRNVRTTMGTLEVSKGGGGALSSLANTYARNVERMEDALFRLQEARAKVSNAIKSAEGAGMDSNIISRWRVYLQVLDAYEKKLQNIKRNDEMMHGNGWQTQTFGTTFKHLLSNANDFERYANQVQKGNTATVESMRRAGIAVSDLAAKFDRLEIAKIRANAVAAKVDTTAYDQAVERMERYKRVLDYIAQHGGHDAGRITGSVGYRNAANDLNVQATALRTLTTEANKASHATQQLSAEEQRLSQALNQTTQAARGQSQVLSDLKSMATQYLGVWGGQQFIHNIIEIGGQLEMQRLSIGAILQNTSQANELFDKIKGLAIQSPFGVVQLDQMTKQLTAYGFKYNELYDMTKRLADISAATGTDVSRLALALGHVRSEAALSGYTLRQFSMANVPLLQKLSEKLGKTTKEIREMVKKKEVGYDDVIGVLKDLTNEGGMFYNMQEVISESVKAKFKNVRDAMDIMYGEMAEGAPGEALKEVANVLMELTRNWKDVATVMGSVAGVWAIHRAAILTMNAALGSNTASVTANMLAYKQKRAAELQSEALTRKLTAEELALVATRKQITAANIRVALSTNAMTKGEALRLVGLRKLSLEEAKALIRSGEFTAAEVRMALQGRVLGMNLGYAGNMMRYFATSAKMAMAAFLTNPWTWAMAGITAMVELWQRNSSEMEKADELGQKIYDRAADGLQRAREMMKETNMTFSVGGKNVALENVGYINGQLSYPDAQSLSDDKIKATIDNWTTFIKDYSATPNIMLNAAFATDEAGNAVHSLAEQYQILGENVKVVIDGMKRSKELSNAFAEAVKDADGGLFDENLTTDMKDYEKAWKEHFKLVNKTVSSYRRYADAALFAARNNKTFLEALKSAKKESASTAEQIMFLAENAEKLKDAKDAFSKAWEIESAKDNNGIANRSWSSMFLTGELSGNYSELREEFNQVADEFEKSMPNWDFKNLDPGQIQALTLTITDSMSEAGLSVDQVRTKVIELCQERWPQIKIDADLVQARAEVNEMQQRLEKLVNPDGKGIGWLIPLNTETNAGEVIEGIIKGYNAAKGFIEQHGISIKAKFGIASDAKIADWSDDKLKELAKGDELAFGILKELRDSYRIINQATKASKEYGFSLDKPDKKGSGNKKTGGTKSYKDEFAKRWDERIRIMKEAYSWYDKWEKKVGNDEAIKETNAKYADIFKEWRTDKLLPMDFDVNEIADYTKYVEKIRDDALKRYQAQKNDKGKNNGQEALRVYRQAVALLNDVKFDNFAKAAEEFRSIIEQTLEDLNERWDIFDAVRNNTGDVSLATRIAGFGAAEVGARTSADAMRNELTSLLQRAGGENLLSKIPLDIHLDEKGLRTMLEDAIPQAGDAEKYKEQIDGLIKAYQEWQKLQRKVIKDDVNVFANLIGSAVSYDAQIKKLQDKLKQQKDSINASVLAGTISQADADKANEIAQAQFDWEKMKLSADYANIYNNAIAMSREEFDGAADAVERMLERLRELELISPNDYVSERDKLNKARNEWSTTGFLGERGAVGQFIIGGYDGLMNYYSRRRATALQNAARSTDAGEKKRWNNEAEHYEKLFDNMSKLSDAAKDVITAFNTLQSGLDLLGNMFDSLGMVGAANATSDAAGVLGGAMQGASALSALGPWGMAAGAGLGLISGLAQVHDKALERQIGKLREDVQKIEANTKLIEQARERTLGFDTGDLRRSYAQDYAPSQTQKMKDLIAKYPWLRSYTFLQGYSSKAQKDIYEYYSGNSAGTGYQQEYQNLLNQREDYLKILDKQESKKKKSQSDIEETKSKIAELDDQIRYFTQDLAKELFDIDIKGWADQLSDALASAFENGESMAKAYKETVTSILQQLMNKMMQLAILEPMFQRLQDKLFGNAEKNISGVFDPNDPKGSMSKVTAMITDFFGKGGEGEKTITAATEFMTAFQRGVQNAGLSVLNDSSNALTSSVQGTSEETSDLLAGYINALRQDVAVNRILFTQFVTQLWPEYVEAFATHVRTVANIDVNVQLMMEMMRDGSGAFFTELSSIRSRLDNVVDGIESLSVR